MTVVLPINIEFKEWASQISIDFPNIPVPPSVDQWKEWASQVVYNNNLKNVPVPTDITYPKEEDWRKWGVYFVDSVYNLISN